jgi:hypothetical protein
MRVFPYYAHDMHIRYQYFLTMHMTHTWQTSLRSMSTKNQVSLGVRSMLQLSNERIEKVKITSVFEKCSAVCVYVGMHACVLGSRCMLQLSNVIVETLKSKSEYPEMQ